MLTKIELNSKEWLSTKDLENEVWKQTKFSNYAISNYGRLKRIAHTNYRKSPSGKEYSSFIPEKICKIWKNRCGYMIYRVTVDGKLKMASIHQLVAQAFIPNPDNLPFINHKNEDKSDNRVENLHWCTAKFNSNYGTCQERRAKTLKGLLAKRELNIKQYTIDGILVKTYSTTGEITKAGFCLKTVKRCCNHKQLTADGYVWFYANEPFKKPTFVDSRGGTIRRKVYCYSTEDKLLKIYDNLKEAAIAVGGINKRSGIVTCIRGGLQTAYGYKWKYAQ